MSTTIIAVLVNLIITGLPYIGVTIGTEQLTVTVQTFVAIITGAWIWYQRYQLGGVTKLGFRKG